MRKRHRRTVEAPEINITAFMNLMVILVPFLLITAVFSQITILQLNLPDASQSDITPPEPDKKEMQLEVIILKDSLLVNDANSGPLNLIGMKEGQYDLKMLNQYLAELKQEAPDKTEITLLAQGDTEYDTIIQLMDAVRVFMQGNNQLELFPDISIGDAPAMAEEGQ